MKILWNGPVFNATGIATSAREIVKALIKRGHQVQVTDPYNSIYDFSKGLETVNNPIDIKDLDCSFVYDYPQFWRPMPGKKTIYHFLHEGTKIWPEWANIINRSRGEFTVPTKAIKNLFTWNGIAKPISIIPYGVSEMYKPAETKEDLEEFVFLSVNSWTGNEGDRKGTDLLIKAFDQEFKDDEKVKLLLKISTFWDSKQPEYYAQQIVNITGRANPNIMFDSNYRAEEKLVDYYQKADCFVAPTRGEGFGLTILNALACGLPVIVTKDNNSGHMDFCKDNPSVLWVDVEKMKQADPNFYVEGNLLAEPNLETLRKQLRYAFENRKNINTKLGSEMARQWTWEKSAIKIEELINGGNS